MHHLYKITNLINNKIYIGQAQNPKNRWSQHKNEARKNEPSMIVNRSMKKYGIDNFTFEIIVSCQTQEDANYLEKELIIQYDCLAKNDKGYNVANGGNTAPKSEEWKQYISEITKARFENDLEYVAQFRQAHQDYIIDLKANNLPIPGTFEKGHEIKPEWTEASRQAHLGRVQSEEEILKRTQNILKHYENNVSPLLGIPLSEEHRNKISKALTGTKRTEETKQNMRNSNNPAWFKKGDKSRRKYSLDEEKHIAELYNLGFSTHELSDMFNLDRKGIGRILKENEVKIRSNKKLTDEQEREIVNLYLSGLSQAKLSKQFNIDKTSISRIIKDIKNKANNNTSI